MKDQSFQCWACQQHFDQRSFLFSHLQTNPFHKQPSATSKSARASQRSGARHDQGPRTTRQSRDIHGGTTRSNEAGFTLGSWLQVTEQQALRLQQVLADMCHPSETLKACQYHLENRSQSELEQRQICINCHRKRSANAGNVCIFHPDHRKTQGKRQNRPRSCCDSTSVGCQTLPEHFYPPIVRDDFERRPSDFVTHQAPPHTSTRAAVTLDCEMVGVRGGASELVRLCAVDFLTGEVLINTLVRPAEPVVEWRTKYSGVKASDIVLAAQQNQLLPGWRAAQSQLWRHVDNETILIGHSLQHDLKALHLIHPRVIDTSIVTRAAVSPSCRRSWSLKVLSADLTNRVIQNHGEKGHDCLEDTFATREVLLRCILWPQKLAGWASVQRANEQRKEKERKRQREQKAREACSPASQDVTRPRARANSLYGWCESESEIESEGEVLFWADIAEDLGWPHPDTGYEPWSD